MYMDLALVKFTLSLDRLGFFCFIDLITLLWSGTMSWFYGSTHFSSSSGTCVCDSKWAQEKVWTCINECFCSSGQSGTFLSGGRNNKVCLLPPPADLWKILLFQVWRESSLLGTLVVLIFCCSPTTKASFYPFLLTLSLGSVLPCPKVWFHKAVD